MASRAKNPLFAEERMLSIEEFKYALESWQQTLAFARTLSSYFISL
jgi:thiamine pyrophosphokinase